MTTAVNHEDTNFIIWGNRKVFTTHDYDGNNQNNNNHHNNRDRRRSSSSNSCENRSRNPSRASNGTSPRNSRDISPSNQPSAKKCPNQTNSRSTTPNQLQSRERSPHTNNRSIYIHPNCTIKGIILKSWLDTKIIWSETEKYALVQKFGGPCCILAPLQAYIILILKELEVHDFRGQRNEQGSSRSPVTVSANDINPRIPGPTRKSVFFKSLHKIFLYILDANNSNPLPVTVSICTSISNGKYSNITLKILKEIESKDVNAHEKVILNNWYHDLQHGEGILLLMYSLVATKGSRNISSEMGIMSEYPQLIEPNNGHGEQAFVNLILTGYATCHTFDGIRDLSEGLLLEGIHNRSAIGFLTIHEHFRLIEVGSNLKNPIYPIWIIASESHYTCCWTNFKIAKNLQESNRNKYKKVLLEHEEQEGCGFFKTQMLSIILSKCNLCCDPEYVSIMKIELDPNMMDIIMFNDFLNIFGESDEERRDLDLDEIEAENSPLQFPIFYYNGYSGNREESDRPVKFTTGTARIVDWANIGADNQIEQVLQTKWSNLRVDWEEDYVPSIS